MPRTAVRAWRLDRVGWALISALFLLAYYPTFRKLIAYWAADDMYSYGFLVPLISGFFIWLKRDQIAVVPVSPCFGLGIAVCGSGLAMLLVGRFSSTNLLEHLSIVVTICGLTLLLLGRRLFRVLMFPIAYLLSMIPFWEFLTASLHPPFQLYSAMIGIGALRLFGIPVLREDFIIELPNIRLEVDEACSGVNNLIAVMCVGIPVTYLFVRGWAKRLFMVAVAALIALLSNGVRVAMVSLFAYYEIRGANGDIHGPFSVLRSVVISGIGFMVLFWLISRFAENDGRFEALWNASGSESAGLRWLEVKPRAFAVAAVMLSVFIGFGEWRRVTAVAPEADLGAFPETIGRWESRGAQSFPSDFERLPFDQHLSRRYVAPDGAEADLFLGYFQAQRPGRELADTGMRTVLERLERSTSAAKGLQTPRVKDFLASVGPNVFHVTYWYNVNGSVVAEHYEAKLFTAWNSIALSRNNGSIIIVRAKARKDDSLEGARLRIRDFIEGLMSASRQYLPHS